MPPDPFIALDDQLTLSARNQLGLLTRWERYLKLKYISTITTGKREQLPQEVQNLVQHFEQEHGSLISPETRSHMLDIDYQLWGSDHQGWNYILLPNGEVFYGDAEACLQKLFQFKKERAAQYATGSPDLK